MAKIVSILLALFFMVQASANVPLGAVSTIKSPHGYDVVIDHKGARYHTGYRPDALENKDRIQKRAFAPHYGAQAFLPLPDEFDLRTKGPIVIDNQGSCGSCWFFGTKGTVQDVVANRDKKQIDVSGQWGIDCQPARFGGCGGGDFAFDKFKAKYGAVYTSEYGKYMARGAMCNTKFLGSGSAYHEQIIYAGYVKGTSGGSPKEDDVMRALVETEGPVAIAISAGGIGPDSSAGWRKSCSMGGVNHIVRIVGYLRGELHGQPKGVYWIIANSWGTGWADKGFSYMRASNASGRLCASLTSAMYINYKPACDPQPKADAGPETNIILGPSLPHSAQIGMPALKDHTYSWSPTTGLSDPNVAQPFASPTRTTEYTVTAATQCGVSTSSVKVHVFRPVVTKTKGAVRQVEEG